MNVQQRWATVVVADLALPRRISAGFAQAVYGERTGGSLFYTKTL
jgi:hypothetical protein